MAQVTEIRLVDDLDGGNADESVDFTVDNKRYQWISARRTLPGYARSSHLSSPPHAVPAAPRLLAPGTARSLPARPAQVSIQPVSPELITGRSMTSGSRRGSGGCG